MQVKLTIGERLKDLRTAQKLTLEQLAAEVGISKSALGKYESDNGKDISPYSILVLADYYGVSCDYLMGRTETKNHPNTALHELHLGDASIDVLKTGKFNHRLLSELICHKDFQRFMLDAEIYVDRIADMRVNDMNAVLEAVRQMALMKNGGEENDLHLRTLEVAQIREDEYFGSLIADDLKGILRDIRSEHRPDTMTADEISLAATMQDQLQDAMNFEGSSEEKKAKALLSTLGIDYDAITMEQFVNLIEVLMCWSCTEEMPDLRQVVSDHQRKAHQILRWLCTGGQAAPHLSADRQSERARTEGTCGRSSAETDL